MSRDESETGGLIGGHPKGLYYLSFTEMWERFSFYGMSALLTLYMVKELLLPGNAEQVMGLAGLRDLFEFRGPMSNLAFASIIYGWYAGLVFFTPIMGGWVADRILGPKRTVMIGVLLMSADDALFNLPDCAPPADPRLWLSEREYFGAGGGALSARR
jgi:proton-dependent oligopeptide transporter, POT family